MCHCLFTFGGIHPPPPPLFFTVRMDRQVIGCPGFPIFLDLLESLPACLKIQPDARRAGAGRIARSVTMALCLARNAMAMEMW